MLQFSLMKAKGALIEPEHLTFYSNQTAICSVQKVFADKKLDEKLVLEALRKSQGNKIEAARTTLYRYIKEYLNYILE